MNIIYTDFDWKAEAIEFKETPIFMDVQYHTEWRQIVEDYTKICSDDAKSLFQIIIKKPSFNLVDPGISDQMSRSVME